MSEVESEVLERVKPWSGVAYVHVEPRDSDRLDIDSLSEQPKGRWNRPQDPTLYFAGDPGVALSELARHLPPDERSTTRDLLRLELAFERVLDLRPEDTCARLGVEGAPFCLLEHSQAQGVASRLRDSGSVEAILVPPMAFLEQTARWNLVVFVDRLAGDGWLREWARIGTLEVRPLDARARASQRAGTSRSDGR